ncbi:MAG: tRNA 2-thiocytidine(32) synthetase TtcA [Anaerolineae bacterium]|nr:tRNA 2-thiocytidine(32) synthetase TtcA [Anaerolineae bacterium]
MMIEKTRVDPARAEKLAYYLLKSLNKAVHRYHLLANGDKILVAVSGGKDSMTLLDLLWRYRRMAKEHYSLVVGHIRTDYHCGQAVPEEWLALWCQARGLHLETETIQIAQELAQTTANKCFRCAWNRRKALFQMAARLGCNKLAFAHHADDIAETALLNLFFSGRLARMEPKVSFFQGKLTVIRPLALVEERDIVPFAEASGFPLTGEPCPIGLDSHRTLVKRILRELESENHRVKRSIFRAVELYNKALTEAKKAPSTFSQEETRA